MCKLMILAGIGPTKSARAWDFVIAASKSMTEHDNDGYGYAALSPSGLWGERWLDVRQAFRTREKLSAATKKYVEDLSGAVEVVESYNSFGTLSSEDTTAIIAHARMATCAKTLENVHPFLCMKEKTALVHNGIITNHAGFTKSISSCDSEAILASYSENDISRQPGQIQALADTLDGSFACGVISHDGDRPVVDIFKNALTSLHVTFVRGLECYAFATSPESLIQGCRKIRSPLQDIVSFKSNAFLRLDAVTGKTLNFSKFFHSCRPGYQAPVRPDEDWPPRGVDGRTTPTETDSATTPISGRNV
jgi:predicted glutamine amidotransferase